MKRTICYLLIIVSFFMFSSSKACAQQATMSIYPPLLEVVIKPGKSILIAYTIENLGDPVIAAAQILPFEPQGPVGGIKIKNSLDGPIRFNLENSDIKLQQSFFMKTKDNQQLLVKIRVPESASDGDYYYSLLVSTKAPPATEGEANSSIRATIGSNMLITVTDSGKIETKGKIANFFVDNTKKLKLFGFRFNFFESSEKIPVRLILENTGNNLIKPQGKVTLIGNFGEKAEYEIIPENILSHSQRLIHASPSSTLENHSLLLSGFFVGKYNLTATANLGIGTPQFFASTTFFALPVKLLLAILIAIIIGVVIIKNYREIE